MILQTTLLADAAATIAGPREQEYGNKLQNFSQIAALWQVLLQGKLQPLARVTAEDVGMLMIAVKLARLTKTPNHRDSLLDIAGYAGCIDELQLQRAANNGQVVSRGEPQVAGIPISQIARVRTDATVAAHDRSVATFNSDDAVDQMVLSEPEARYTHSALRTKELP